MPRCNCEASGCGAYADARVHPNGTVLLMVGKGGRQGSARFVERVVARLGKQLAEGSYSCLFLSAF